MDAASPPLPGPPQPRGAGLVGAAVVPTAPGAIAPDGAEVAVRVVPVAPGQTLQATVVALQDGLAWLGYRGALFSARVDKALVPGTSYEFSVVRTAPVVELALRAKLGELLPHALPGPSADRLRTILSGLEQAPHRAGSEAVAAASTFASVTRALAHGEVSAPLLRELVRGLGHDLEARVLRLLGPTPAAPASIALELRATQKAEALAALAGEDASGDPAEGPRRALLTHLGTVERENAMRAELGLPTWLPLPNCPAVGLDDARWFLVQEDGGSGEGAGPDEDSLTLVLLLEFSRLGAIRVDVVLCDTEVDVTMTAAEATTAAHLLAESESLRADLTQGGLTTRSLKVQRSPTRRLPQNDLATPPVDGTSLVDCRA